jgi:hypothetical protein
VHPRHRAAVIERLIEVGYVSRRARRLFPRKRAGADRGGAGGNCLAGDHRALGKGAQRHRGAAGREKNALLAARFMEGIRRYGAFLVEAGAAGAGGPF